MPFFVKTFFITLIRRGKPLLYNSQVKAVLFDYGGTLDSDGQAWPRRFYAIYKEAGLAAAPEALERAFYDSDDALPKLELAGLSLEETLNLQVGLVLERFKRPELRAAIVGRFLSECRRTFARNKPVLELLSKRFKLGVVSNFYGNLESCLASEGLLPHFKVVVDSAKVGAVKPEPAIFNHALVALGCEPGEAVMVGDSIPRDMRGAEKLGMPHVLIGTQPPCCPAALRAARFTDIPEVLSCARA